MVGSQSNASRGLTAQAIVLALAVLAPVTARAQDIKLKVDDRSSLAWWQMSPHLLHLWATTCPGESSWQPGAEHSSGWVIDDSRYPSTGHANIVDTVHVPLYPRPIAQAVCTPAVRGDFTVRDTSKFTGVKGNVAVRAEYLITGLEMRDTYARKAVLQTSSYPDVKFQVDSLINQRKSGDTTTADAYGVLELHGVRSPKMVVLHIWHEPLGIRVTGKFKFPGSDLPEVYKISRISLGLGVGTGLWKIVHLGIDAILVPAS